MKNQPLRSAADGEFQDGPIGLACCPTLDPLQKRAERYAKEVSDEYNAISKKQRPPKLSMCVAVVRDKKTGIVYYARSGDFTYSGDRALKRSEAHPDLDMPIKSLETKIPLGSCAETKAINKALWHQQRRDGHTRKEDLQIAAANVADGSPKQCCKNCLRMTASMSVSPATARTAVNKNRWR